MTMMTAIRSAESEAAEQVFVSVVAGVTTEFYENKLFIVPSPYTQQAGLGLRFHHVADGIFETGTTRTNPVGPNSDRWGWSSVRAALCLPPRRLTSSKASA